LNWVEVRIVVDGESAEPVAELFGRHGAGAVIVGSKGPDEHGPGSVIVRTYLQQGPECEALTQRIYEGLWHLGQIRPLPPAVLHEIEEKDWTENWREDYSPVEVGKRLLIHPPWLELEDTQRKVIFLDPGMAFGTGTHPSTRLSLELMERFIKPGDHMIDLGCGSGILSIAAIKLGAGHVWAYDHGDSAIEATITNAHANGVAEGITVRQGSLEEIKQDFSLRAAPDLLVANLLTPIHVRLLGEGLAAIVSGQCRLILSGMLEEQADELLEVTAPAGLEHENTVVEATWIAMCFRKK
jgi:ribosomal protein L11 methyltransferase